MPKNAAKRYNPKNDNATSALGFEATLWATVDKLRGKLDTVARTGPRVRAPGLFVTLALC
jgi:hypothetical protein